MKALILTLLFSTAVNATVVVRWTTEADAGQFYDPNPNSKYIEHNGQACVKDVVEWRIVDGKRQRIIKIRCRQPNGKFSYIW